MKSVPSACTAAAALISVLAIPAWLGAQDGAQQNSPSTITTRSSRWGPSADRRAASTRPAMHPTSMFNQILTRRGAMLAGADTPIPDPDEFAGPFVNYAFRWENGVQSTPYCPSMSGRSASPCFNCPWSSFAFWIADNGFVAGQSVHNAMIR